MTVRVHSARVSYNGADRLDITRASATGHGLAWRTDLPCCPVGHIVEAVGADCAACHRLASTGRAGMLSPTASTSCSSVGAV